MEVRATSRQILVGPYGVLLAAFAQVTVGFVQLRRRDEAQSSWIGTTEMTWMSSGRLPVGWTWGEPAIGHGHHALARIGPMLATIIACARGQAPVASTWHPCQRGPDPPWPTAR